MKPQKPKTKIKIGKQKKYKDISPMNCLIGLFDESTSTEPW